MQQYSDIPFEIFTIDNLYSQDEINTYLNYVKNSDIKNRTFTYSDFKNGKMILPEISNNMFSKIKHYLPDKYIDRNNNNWTYIKPSKYVMYANFIPGQQFNIHTDTGESYDEINNLYSKYTVLTYLNDDYQLNFMIIILIKQYV